MRYKQTIDGSLPIIAKAIGGKMDVRVHVGGANAYSDGRVVHVPFGDPDDADYRTLAVGYTVHEGGHIRHTDFAAKAALRERPVALALYRCLEDVRIERAVIRELPGTARYLQDLCQVLVDRGGAFEAVSEDTAEHAKLASYILYRLRHDVLDQSAFTDLAEQAEQVVKSTFPSGAITRLTALMFQVTDAKSTADVVRLAARIADMLEDEARASSAPADEGRQRASEGGEGSSSSERGSDSDPGGSIAQTASSAPGTADPVPDVATAEPPTPASGAQAALQRAVQADWTDLPTDTGDVVARALEQEAASTPNGHFGGMAEPDDPGLTLGDGDALIQQCSAACNALSTRLVNLVEASREVETRASRSGELDPDALHEIVFANAKLFVEEEPREEVNTAVQILLDRSGSMRHRIELARQAALATALALARIADVQVAVAAFPGQRGVTPLTRFGESPKRTAARYTIRASGGTPMAEAIWWAAAELNATEAERKILLVVTDGEPNNAPMTTDIVQRCEASGFELRAIGIGTEAARNYFVHSSRIDAIDDLSAAMFALLQPRLFDTQYRDAS